MIQYNTMYYYTDITWIPGVYSDYMTGNNDRVLTRIYTDYFLVWDQSNSLIYTWELTECNDVTDQSLCDQYIVTSGRYTQCKEPRILTMPPPRSVLWSHFQLQDGKLWNQLTFFIIWCLVFLLYLWTFLNNLLSIWLNFSSLFNVFFGVFIQYIAHYL